MDSPSRSLDGTVQEKASDARAALEAAVRNSRAKFVARLAEYHKTLDHTAEVSMGEDRVASAFDEAMFVAHRIAGVGQTLGFPDLGELARQTETAIAACQREQDSAALRDVSCSQIRRLADLIKAICADHGEWIS